MENIELLPDFNIDEVKTANRVEKFLLKAIPLFEAQSQLEQLQSPSLSGMPGGVSVGNGTEEKILQKMGANDKLYLINRAIDYCPYNKNYILQELYLEGKPEYILRKELHYSRSRFWKLKQEALIWFAEIFAPYYDLRVKK